MNRRKKYEAIVIGMSAGGLTVLKTFLPLLPADFNLPIIIVQHISASSENGWIEVMNKFCSLSLKEADEKELIQKGRIYAAPVNYHLLVEKDKTFSLTIDEKVNYARPSIDVLFETASDAFRESLIGIILTGSNRDGVDGLKKIKEAGGLVIVQDPEEAEAPVMPLNAIKEVKVDHVLTIKKIAVLLNQLNKDNHL